MKKRTTKHFPSPYVVFLGPQSLEAVNKHWHACASAGVPFVEVELAQQTAKISVDLKPANIQVHAQKMAQICKAILQRHSTEGSSYAAGCVALVLKGIRTERIDAAVRALIATCLRHRKAL